MKWVLPRYRVMVMKWVLLSYMVMDYEVSITELWRDG